MSNQETTKRAKPGDGPFDDPAMTIAPEPAAILVPTMQIIVSIGTRQNDATRGEPFTKGIAVVGAVGDEVFGMTPVGGDARLQRRVDERDFRGRRRGNGDSQRNTLTLDQYHAL